MNNGILLVGTVSNVACSIEKELKVVLRALSIFDTVQVHLVESDSTDLTVARLESIRKRNDLFSYESLGSLRNNIPSRIERLRFCRNRYVDFIRKNYENNSWSYIAVADLDGMNKKLSKRAVNSCFSSVPIWDGVMANQRRGYYDLLALRCSNWIESDVLNLVNESKAIRPNIKTSAFKIITFFRLFSHYDKIRELAIYNEMRVIPTHSSWIKVLSAFGGFAMYRTQLFLHNNYDQRADNESKIDHVDFNLKCVDGGAIFYINPMLINSNWNIHNINRVKLIRFLKELKKFYSKK